jgi:3-oxoadipate enol-lactonase
MLALGTGFPEKNEVARRVYALDFWGFGDSSNPDKAPDSPYVLTSYVEMVREFMDNMGIVCAPIAGHSLGGTVALQFALTYPERTEKVIIVGSPIVGSSLNPFLKLAGYGWIARLVWFFPFVRSAIIHILLSGDSPQVQQMIFRDVERTSLDSFFRSIGDLRDTDLRTQLPHLSVPTMGIYGIRDNIVSPKDAEILISETKHAEIAMMHRSRHFPMTDEPKLFMDVVTAFLNQTVTHENNRFIAG